MAEFWQITFPMPGKSEEVARRAEEAGWDGQYFAMDKQLFFSHFKDGYGILIFGEQSQICCNVNLLNLNWEFLSHLSQYIFGFVAKGTVGFSIKLEFNWLHFHDA